MSHPSLILVSCVGSKLSEAAPARDLYTSAWFRKARAYAEHLGAEWFILSAKHGLTSPLTVIEPYEQTLNQMSVGERRDWATPVIDGLRMHMGSRNRVQIFAGRHYREFLVPALEDMGIFVSVPMEGLGIGQQLAWLDQHTPPIRVAHLRRFYELMSELGSRLGGRCHLSGGRGSIHREARGVYFFFEQGESRTGSGSGPRVVRVGTHGLVEGTKSTVWSRLAQHRGRAKTPGGNHRGSIFRLLVGNSLIRRDGHEQPTWGAGASASKSTGEAEQELEACVSGVIQKMPYLWLEVPDDPGPSSMRGMIERNSIALLSNRGGDPIDGPSKNWLGNSCDRELVRSSGLWNQNHVDEGYDPDFLEILEKYVRRA